MKDLGGSEVKEEGEKETLSTLIFSLPKSPCPRSRTLGQCTCQDRMPHHLSHTQPEFPLFSLVKSDVSRTKGRASKGRHPRVVRRDKD